MMSFSADLHSVAAQKDPRGVPAYTLYVNRRLGRVVAAAAHQVHLKPNQLTFASGLLALAGLALLVLRPPTPTNSLGVAALLSLAFVFDSADGQLARLSKRTSMLGEWLDHLIDAAKHVLLPLGVFISADRFLDPPTIILAFPLVFQFIAVLTFSSVLLVDLLMRTSSISRPASSPREVRMVALVKLPIDYGLMCLAMVLFGTDVFWWVYGVLLLLGIVYFVVHVYVTMGKLRTLPPAVAPAAAHAGVSLPSGDGALSVLERGEQL